MAGMSNQMVRLVSPVLLSPPLLHHDHNNTQHTETETHTERDRDRETERKRPSVSVVQNNWLLEAHK